MPSIDRETPIDAKSSDHDFLDTDDVFTFNVLAPCSRSINIVKSATGQVLYDQCSWRYNNGYGIPKASTPKPSRKDR